MTSTRYYVLNSVLYLVMAYMYSQRIATLCYTSNKKMYGL